MSVHIKKRFFKSLVSCAAIAIFMSASTLVGQVHNNKPLELSGLSLSQAYDIEDDLPLDLDEPMILQLIYRIKKTSSKSRRKYSQYSKDVTWEQLSSKTEDYRLWVFDRKFRLKKITKHRFASAEKEDPVKGVFVCHCVTEQGEQGEQPLVILSRTIPRSLPVDTDLDEPIRLHGFLFARRQVGSPTAEVSEAEASDETETEASATPVFIVDRIGWYPDQVVQSLSNESYVALAQSGLDVGLLDFVRENNARKLVDDDSEAFYQMIGSVNRMGPNAEFANQLGFVEIMRGAKSNFGNAAKVKGVIRSCSEINITNPELASQIGVSKYYQLIMFPDLDGSKIVVKNKDGEDIEYKRFPITVCCLQLPAGFSTTTIERKPFSIEGFFFRFWKYQSDKTDAAGASGQVSPLIIANTPIPIDSQEERLNFILLCFVGILIVGFSILTWWYRNADRRRKSPGQKIIESLPEKLDVKGIQQ